MAETSLIAPPNYAKRRRLRFSFGLRTFLLAFAILSIPLGLLSRELVRLRQQRAIVEKLAAGGGASTYDFRLRGSNRAPAPAILRTLFGDDFSADVAAVNWEYTYTPIDGANIELLARLPGVREVRIVGSEMSNGRPKRPAGAANLADLERADVDSQAASFATLRNCKNLRRLTLYGGLTADEHLKALVGNRNLRSLAVLNSPLVGDEGVKAIATYEALTVLRISKAPHVTDTGASALDRLIGLKSLDLSGTAIGDESLSHIGSLANLEVLILSGCGITDEGLSKLSQLRGLSQLNLAYTPVTDAGMRSLATCRELRELDLSGTKITDAGLADMVNLVSLSTLRLAGTQITDEGLSSLENNSSLRHLSVTLGEHLSRERLQRLKKYLPLCLIACERRDPLTSSTILDAWE